MRFDKGDEACDSEQRVSNFRCGVSCSSNSLQRLPNYPDVPPISGTFAGVEVIGWFTIAAPARTPRDVLVKMNEELDKILKDPEVVQQLATVGFFTEGAGTPDETRDFVKAQYDLWGKVTRDIGLQPE